MNKFNYLGNVKQRGKKRTLLCGRQLHSTQNTDSSLKGWPLPSAVHWQCGMAWEWRKIQPESNNLMLYSRQDSCPEKEKNKSYLRQNYKISRWKIEESVVILRNAGLKWNRYLPHGAKMNKANYCQLLKWLLKVCSGSALSRLVSQKSILWNVNLI